MTESDNLARDEERRLAQHEQAKQEVGQEAQEAIRRNADFDARDEARAAALGEQFKDRAIREVAETGGEINRARGIARVSQVVDYLFYMIYGIISLELLLELIGARESSGFRQFIETISAPFLAPFKSLVADPAAGQFRLRLSYIIALVVYILLHLAVNGLLRMMAHRKTEV